MISILPDAQQHSEKYQLVFHEKENDRQGY